MNTSDTIKTSTAILLVGLGLSLANSAAEAKPCWAGPQPTCAKPGKGGDHPGKPDKPGPALRGDLSVAMIPLGSSCVTVDDEDAAPDTIALIAPFSQEGALPIPSYTIELMAGETVVEDEDAGTVGSVTFCLADASAAQRDLMFGYKLVEPKIEEPEEPDDNGDVPPPPPPPPPPPE